MNELLQESLRQVPTFNYAHSLIHRKRERMIGRDREREEERKGSVREKKEEVGKERDTEREKRQIKIGRERDREKERGIEREKEGER
jgi:hypothetical protein